MIKLLLLLFLYPLYKMDETLFVVQDWEKLKSISQLEFNHVRRIEELEAVIGNRRCYAVIENQYTFNVSLVNSKAGNMSKPIIIIGAILYEKYDGDSLEKIGWILDEKRIPAWGGSENWLTYYTFKDGLIKYKKLDN